MQWFKLLLIPINLLVVQSEACKQKMAKAEMNKTQVVENMEEKKEYENLYATWVESGIDEEGLVYRLPPRRGGISQITFNSDGSIIEKGPLNCGFGRQYEGKFSFSDDGKSIVANYDRTTKYMGQDKAPEPVEVVQKFDIVRIAENELILIRYDGGGGEKRMGFLKKQLWDSLESNDYPKK